MSRPAPAISPGQRFCDWEVIKEAESVWDNKGMRRRRYLCLCRRCDTTTSEVYLQNLQSGRSTCCVECAKGTKPFGPNVFRYLPATRRVLRSISDDELGNLLEAATDEFRGRIASREAVQ